LVEDHQDTANFLKRFIEQRGHTVRLAASMQAALEQLALAEADFLLSDIALPDGDGWTLMQLLPAGEAPGFAVAMSGLGTDADRSRSGNAGFRRHLRKPFEILDLDDLLQQACREKNIH
jgi:CheY-like chemotaxis protein